jgi:hypothetical protein
MAATCAVCGAKLGLGRRLSGNTLCEADEAKQVAALAAAAQARTVAVAEYVHTAELVVSDPTAATRLAAIAAQAGMAEADRRLANVKAVEQMIAMAIADAYLTPDEEASIERMISTLGLTQPEATQAMSGQDVAFQIAGINAGRMPNVSDPDIFLKPGEVAYLQVDATLLKEVVHRQTRGGYSGFSIPVTKGIYYRIGGYAGHSVVTGTSIDAADSGILCVTSQRVVFKGLSSTVECLYAKLVGLNVFDDGIEFNVSNRQKATLLKVPNGHVVAAVVNAAMHPEGVTT